MNWKHVVSIFFSLALLTGCDFGPVAEAKEAVRSKMKDPDSTKFRDVEVCHNDQSVIQGEVNAKNGFGAYTGFESFFHSGHRTALSSEVSLDEWREWNVRCFGEEIVKETDEIMAKAREAAQRVQTAD